MFWDVHVYISLWTIRTYWLIKVTSRFGLQTNYFSQGPLPPTPWGWNRVILYSPYGCRVRWRIREMFWNWKTYDFDTISLSLVKIPDLNHGESYLQTRRYTVNNLTPHTTYRVWVSCRTLVSYGDEQWSDWSVVVSGLTAEAGKSQPLPQGMSSGYKVDRSLTLVLNHLHIQNFGYVCKIQLVWLLFEIHILFIISYVLVRYQIV